MSRSLRQLALLAAALAAAGAGCTRSVVQNKQPPDPLLVSKKPVEGKPRSAAPAPPRGEATARVDPPPPPAGVGGDATVAAPDPDVRRPARLSSEVVVRPESPR